MKDEPDQNDYVAIHYRAGDYIDDPAAQHPRCSKEYYEKAMALFPGEKFILFSDDPLVWLNMMQVDGITYHDENTYVDDFRLMKRCKSFICANSSFSSFAALLGEHPEKKIVQPSRWFGTQMPPEWVTDDVYHENAIVI